MLKKFKVCLILLAGCSLAYGAESDMKKLAMQRNCMACHSMEKKVVGPAFKDVAIKYENDKGAVDKLTLKVLKGGSGVWGVLPMPANLQLSEEEYAQTLFIINIYRHVKQLHQNTNH